MIDKVTIDRFAEISGYTAHAIRTKIERGVWPEGVYIRAPDNRILISIRGYEEWAEGELRSGSPTCVSGVVATCRLLCRCSK